MWRMRLLGAAVRVSSDSFPELQAAVDEVRSRLNYTDRLDIHVVGKHNPPMELTSYFGTRVLILEGGAVADLTAPSSRSQLIFILSTFVGALKAKHARWTPAFIALEVLGLTGVLTPFINPWHRATVYSGDQIAYVSCADLKVSIEAVHRVLVGREIVPQLHAEGIITQANVVRRSRILRLSQLIMAEPHATNRYLNLLAFAQQREPESVASYRSTITKTADSTLMAALPSFRRRASSGASARAGLVLAGCVLLASIIGGWASYGATAPGPEVVPSEAVLSSEVAATSSPSEAFTADTLPEGEPSMVPSEPEVPEEEFQGLASDLQQFAFACADGDYAGCDELYRRTPVGSEWEDFGSRCGNVNYPETFGDCANTYDSSSAFGYGEDPFLDALWDACAAGDSQACNLLYLRSASGSQYEEYGATCAGTVPDGTGQTCA